MRYKQVVQQSVREQVLQLQVRSPSIHPFYIQFLQRRPRAPTGPHGAVCLPAAMYWFDLPLSSAWTLSARGASCTSMIISTSWILSAFANAASSSRFESSCFVRTVYDWHVWPSVPPSASSSFVHFLGW